MPQKQEKLSPDERKDFLRRIQGLSANDVLKNLRSIKPDMRANYVQKLYYVGVLANIMNELNAARRIQFYQLAKKNISPQIDECMREALREAKMRGR